MYNQHINEALIMQASPVTRRSLDQLEDEIVSLSHRFNATEYQFLILVREFDIRQGWRAYCFNNCAEWLNMKCGISLGAAREKVRVALALFDLPLCSKAFEAGSLSYSKARAMTRIADCRNEPGLLEYALSATASQVEDHCRQLRNAQRGISTDDANRAYKERSLTRTSHPDGTMSINLELPKELGDLVMKAIDIAMASAAKEISDAKKSADEIKKENGCDNGCECNNGCDAESPAKNPASLSARQADGLLQITRHYLSVSNNSGKTTSTADNHLVVVHVDESALQDKGGKSDLPVESVRRLTCDTNVVEVIKDKKGNILNLGRKHRVVSPQLKRALLSRDKSCCFPGCAHDKWLAGHHVRHWVDGGETSLANTLLLCSRHHRLLHEGGYTIQKNFAGDWYFRNRNGKVIPGAPVYMPICESIHEPIYQSSDEPVYKTTKYDASRDALGDAKCVKERQAVYALG